MGFYLRPVLDGIELVLGICFWSSAVHPWRKRTRSPGRIHFFGTPFCFRFRVCRKSRGFDHRGRKRSSLDRSHHRGCCRADSVRIGVSDIRWPRLDSPQHLLLVLHRQVCWSNYRGPRSAACADVNSNADRALRDRRHFGCLRARECNYLPAVPVGTLTSSTATASSTSKPIMESRSVGR